MNPFLTIIKNVRKTIGSNAMLENGDHLLVALSGGPDSVALLRVLVILSNEYGLRLTAAHLNHSLRGAEADRDEDFVRCLSAETGIDCVFRTVDIRSLHAGQGRSLEDVARQERYRFLEDAAVSCGARKIATGHHRSDQAETVLINLIRGSGSEGLKGILPVRDGRIIRPLLDVGKSEILAFLKQEGITYVSDSSNTTRCFLRNRIRNDLIPELIRTYNPRLIDGLCQTADIMRRDDEYLQEVVRKILSDWGIVSGRKEVRLPLVPFYDLHAALQRRVIKTLLEGCAEGGNGIGYRHIDAVLHLVHTPRRLAALDLPGGVQIKKTGNALCIGRKPICHRGNGKRAHGALAYGFEWEVKVPGMVSPPESGKSILFGFVEIPSADEMKERPQTAFMDYDRICPPLTLRNIRPGDRMVFMGMSGAKKVHDYFIDRKISRTMRNRIPLLTDAESVIWIAGERISERVKVTALTKRVLKAEMI